MSDRIMIVIGVVAVIIIAIVFVILKTRGKKKSENKVFEEYTEHYDTGELKHKYFSDSENGPKDGEEHFFYKNGNVNKIQIWISGKRHGPMTVFYPTGEMYIESNYTKNKLNGTYTVFSKQGDILESYTYKSGTVSSKKTMKTIDTDLPQELSDEFPSAITDEISDNIDYFMEEYQYAKENYDNGMEKYEQSSFEAQNRNWAVRGLKKITGIKALTDRKDAKNIKRNCNRIYGAASELTEAKDQHIKDTINAFGRYRLVTLQKTVGRFLVFLDDMGRKKKKKEYEILGDVGLNMKTIDHMREVDMSVGKALGSTAITGALGAAAAMGTPALVTGAVTALASASTGTAISTLSGAAASNAVLAWLGGGSIAAGGGGMAAGSAVLSALTGAATGGVAILAAGLMASIHYSKKLTEAVNYQKEIDVEIAKMEKAWAIVDNIENRTKELSWVTYELEHRIAVQLEYLEPLIVDFDTDSDYNTSVFQKTALLVKAMSELAQTPLFDETGELTSESIQIVSKTRKILNLELKTS